MDQIRKILATIQKHLGGMTATQKLLIGSLAVIMLMALFLVSQYAGRPSMLAVWPGLSSEDQKRAAGVLKNAGFVVETDAKGEAVVPASQQLQAQAALAQAGQQPSNSQLVFDNIIKHQNWINSKEQNREIYRVMRNNWLAGVIGAFRGVHSAKVFVDAPEQVGLGGGARPAKASVTIFSMAGTLLSQETVDAAAKTVAGSVAGLDLERVSVIDGTTGSPRKVRTDGEHSATSNRDLTRATEKDCEEKLSTALSYIDGVIVAVTATVDNTRQRIQTTKNLPSGEGTVVVPSKEMTSSQTETQASNGAEPGVRSNTRIDITTGGATGTKSEQKQEDTQYTTAIGTERKDIEDPRGVATRLAATITVPRGFIIGLVKDDAPAAAAGGAAPAAPTDTEIQARFDKEKVRIAEAAQVHLHTQKADGTDVPGEVVVLLASGGSGGGMSGGGGNGGGSMGGGAGGGTFGTIWAMGGGMMDKAVLGALAVVALGMMLMMVRKAGRRIEMPSAEELVGLPPALDARSDLVGEADETETAMPGIEVGEDEIKATKMRESVSEFIKESPDAASKLLNRWIAVEH